MWVFTNVDKWMDTHTHTEKSDPYIVPCLRQMPQRPLSYDLKIQHCFFFLQQINSDLLQTLATYDPTAGQELIPPEKIEKYLKGKTTCKQFKFWNTQV